MDKWDKEEKESTSRKLSEEEIKVMIDVIIKHHPQHPSRIKNIRTDSYGNVIFYRCKCGYKFEKSNFFSRLGMTLRKS